MFFRKLLAPRILFNKKFIRMQNMKPNVIFNVNKKYFSIEMNKKGYEVVSREALDTIQYALEDDNLVESIDCDLEVDREGDVLELIVDGEKTWVINRHNATKQIWLSSPLSGPRKFVYDNEKSSWVDQRNEDIALLKLVEEEMKQILELSTFQF